MPTHYARLVTMASQRIGRSNLLMYKVGPIVLAIGGLCYSLQIVAAHLFVVFAQFLLVQLVDATIALVLFLLLRAAEGVLCRVPRESPVLVRLGAAGAVVLAAAVSMVVLPAALEAAGLIR